MKKMLLVTAIIMTVLTGCHTIHGVGQDVKAGGEHLSNAAH
ncbi:entericidin A/B family lipoprotein [Snodgrassella sp. B3882]|nr:entericidin A/B family lipoprotein [Snodgrassella sp. B3882]MCX8744641.1 entericidin A/B family lipoprotein [Snodgrassella sp. B3882]